MVVILKVAYVRMYPHAQIVLAHRVGQMAGENLLEPNLFVAAGVDGSRPVRHERSGQLRAEEEREHRQAAEARSDAAWLGKTAVATECRCRGLLAIVRSKGTTRRAELPEESRRAQNGGT